MVTGQRASLASCCITVLAFKKPKVGTACIQDGVDFLTIAKLAELSNVKTGSRLEICSIDLVTQSWFQPCKFSKAGVVLFRSINNV